MKVPAVVYHGIATALPALLGQGLVYLCIIGEIGAGSAIAAMLAMGASVLAAATYARSVSERSLVASNLPPDLVMRRLRRRGGATTPA